MHPQQPIERVWQGLAWVLVSIALALLLLRLVEVAQTDPGPGAALVDYDAFHIVGRLTVEGRGAAAYDLAEMTRIQRGELGQEGVMPWTYPPPYHLVTAALAGLGRGTGFALFVVVTAALWLAVVAALAGRQFPTAVLALLPPVAITASLGQNAFLIGALAGAACWLALRAPGRGTGAAGGWPLGLLVLKPHLGLGLGLHALAAGGWGLLARAVVVAGLACGVATLLLGPGIWGAFLGAVRDSGGLLGQGGYPLYRMVSVHALARTLGLSGGAAGAVQAGAALLACAGLVALVRAGVPPRWSLAAACALGPLVSPYFYDYDLLTPGIGLALVLPDLARRTGLALRLGIVALAWVAGGWGVYSIFRATDLSMADRFAQIWNAPAVGAVAYLALLGLVAFGLSRPLREPEARP